jgi:hypothetical protein
MDLQEFIEIRYEMSGEKQLYGKSQMEHFNRVSQNLSRSR